MPELNDLLSHPRPQLRRDFSCIDGEWDIVFDYKNAGIREQWFQNFPHNQAHRIQVPFSYETENSNLDEELRTQKCSVLWYKYTLDSIVLNASERCLIHFEGIDQKATYWLNGDCIGSSQGAYHRHSFDLSPYLAEENILIIRVEDDYSREMMRGKQRWQDKNFGCWYTPTSGIWKSVWIEKCGDAYIENIDYEMNEDDYSCSVEVTTNRHFEGEAKIELFYGEKLISCVSTNFQEKKAKVDISVVDQDESYKVHFWQIRAGKDQNQPASLYDVHISLIEDSQVCDSCQSYFGYRSLSTEKKYLTVNKMFCYQRLILDQGYWAESGLTAPSSQSLLEDVQAIIDLGFNGVRKHQKIEDERFYALCDYFGLIVWAEAPSAYEFSSNAIENFSQEWIQIVRQLKNHPSIVTWVPFNESWGIFNVRKNKKTQDFVKGICSITRSLDSSRPVVSNDGWEHIDSDIITVHDYIQNSQELTQIYQSEDWDNILETTHNPIFAQGYKYESQPVVMSEYGGIALKESTGNTRENSIDEDWGYGEPAESKEFFYKRYEELTVAIQNIKGMSGFCYTQLTDVEQEVNGLLDAHHRPKLDMERIREINERRVF